MGIVFLHVLKMEAVEGKIKMCRSSGCPGGTYACAGNRRGKVLQRELGYAGMKLPLHVLMQQGFAKRITEREKHESGYFGYVWSYLKADRGRVLFLCTAVFSGEDGERDLCFLEPGRSGRNLFAGGLAAAGFSGGSGGLGKGISGYPGGKRGLL